MKTLQLSSCIILSAAALAFSEPGPEATVVDLVADLESADLGAEASRLDLGDEQIATARNA